MFTYFQKCIFCFKHLPEKPTGDGEHVIPKNIGGFWRVYDICDSCRQYFGDNVDQLSIKNPWIINAIKQLGISDHTKYSDNLPFIGKDTIDGSSVEMIKKDNNFKNKVRRFKDDFFECSEDDWKNIGQKWIKSTIRKNVDPSILEKKLNRLEKEYVSLKPGETVKSKILDITIRKRQVKEIQLATDKLPSITPLIAKIASIFIFYFLPPRVVKSMREIESLVNYARYNKEIRQRFINWCPVLVNEEYQKVHAIRMHAFDHTIVLDISLFGYPNWRIILYCNDKIVFDPFENLEYDTLIFILDFRNQDDRQKLIGIKSGKKKDYKYFNIKV